MKKVWAMIVATVMLGGCSNDMSDLEAYLVSVHETTNYPIEPYPEFQKTPTFKYSAGNTRDPFQRLERDNFEVVEATQAQCHQPDMKRTKAPLERYGVDALKVKGFFTSLGRTYALIVASDQSVHQATVGDRLGLFFGKISKIADGKVYFVEQLPDGTGCWQEKEAVLTMSDTMGSHSNV